MPKQDIKRDYAEIVEFAEGYIGKRAIECIEAYARKRRIVEHRAGKAFWGKADDGEIIVSREGTVFFYIKGVKKGGQQQCFE